ncbi:MAG: DUF3552 domain-containing protein, partial [Planctomycetes bacterium]|nr:DUF3552 domain-containing protein [Planctomycetota bacterium]
MNEMTYYMLIAAAFVVGALLRHIWGKYQVKSSENDARRIRQQANHEAKQICKDAEIKAKEDNLRERQKMDKEFRNERNELKSIEKRLTKREDNLDAKSENLDKKEAALEKTGRDLTAREHELQKRYEAVNETIQKQEDKLLEISTYTREQAESEIFRRLEEQLAQEIEQRVERADQRYKEIADERGQEILTTSIQRLAVDYTTTNVTSTVELPHDEMKGRIIGREGRNIRA